MKARKWLAGLLSAVMLVSTVAPAAAAAGDSFPQQLGDTSVSADVSSFEGGASERISATQQVIFAFQKGDGTWHEYSMEIPALSLPEGDEHERVVAEGDEAGRTWLEENGVEVPEVAALLEGSGYAAEDYSGISIDCVKWVTQENEAGGDWHVDFSLVEAAQEPAPEGGTVWGPHGESWALTLTLTCENPNAVHTGGNTTGPKAKNFLSKSNWDWENANIYQQDGVWYAECALNGAKLLNEEFGGEHTVTSNVEYTLVYENNKWCIDTDAEKAEIVVTGTCTENGPAAPVLGENLDVWAQLYSDDGYRKGGQMDSRPTQYGPSISFGEPYEDAGIWQCAMTVTGYSEDAALAEHCYVNANMPEGYELSDDAVKTVTITYDQDKGEWVCPEISKEHLTSASTAKYGVSFKIQEIGSEPAPEGGTVWGPHGESWALTLTLTCENPNAVHTGGNTTGPKSKNSLSKSNWDWENANIYQQDGVWYAECALNGAKLLNEEFGGEHTVTSNAEYTLVYENNKWCIDTETEKAEIVVTGTCTENGPAAPVLGKNLEVWVQIYAGEYDPKRGSQIDRYANTYGPSVSMTEPEQVDGVWQSQMTVTGYSEDADLAEHCYVNVNMPEGYELDDDAVKTVTITYDQAHGEWVCPELPLTVTSNGPGEKDPETYYGVAFKVREIGAEPETPTLPTAEEAAYLFNNTGAPTGRRIVVSCIESGSDHPDMKRYNVEASDITLGELQGNAESGYTVEVTIDYSRAIGLYCEENGPHKAQSVSSESTTRVLKYSDGAWVRENGNSLAVQLVHEEEEPAPTLPTAEEAAYLFNNTGAPTGRRIVVSCIESGSDHPDMKRYNVEASDITLGELQGDAESGYTVEVTIDYSRVIDLYSAENGPHKAQSVSSESTTRVLKYSDGEWVRENGNSLAVQLVHEEEEPGPSADLTEEDVSDLMEGIGLVTLNCTNGDYSHRSITFTLRDGFDLRKDSETVYTVTIHLDDDGYLDAYDDEVGRTHDTVGSSNYSFQITWEDGEWNVPDTAATIRVRCTSPSSSEDDDDPENSSTVIVRPGDSSTDADGDEDENGGTVIDEGDTPLAPGIFTDVPAGHWASEAVSFVAGRGIFTGTSATTFSPDMVMSRAMLATVLWRMEGQPASTAANPFTDVPAGQWYTNAVIWAAEEGVVKGIGNNLFDPNGLITREQMATMLYRYAGSPAVTSSGLSGYGDQAQVSDFAVDGMEWAVSQGIITGKTGNLLDPQGGATRAEVATMLMRYIQNQE